LGWHSRPVRGSIVAGSRALTRDIFYVTERSFPDIGNGRIATLLFFGIIRAHGVSGTGCKGHKLGPIGKVYQGWVCGGQKDRLSAPIRNLPSVTVGCPIYVAM
jgi:hypothetical protein